jgi:hypothetical protein
MVDDLMSLVLSQWHCTPEQICAMIDLLVEYGGRVDRLSRGHDRKTPLDAVASALRYLGSGDGAAAGSEADHPVANAHQIAVLKAARARLLHHGAKMHSARVVPSEYQLERARKRLAKSMPELED